MRQAHHYRSTTLGLAAAVGLLPRHPVALGSWGDSNINSIPDCSIGCTEGRNGTGERWRGGNSHINSIPDCMHTAQCTEGRYGTGERWRGGMNIEYSI